MRLPALKKLGLLEYASETRERFGGMEEAVFPASAFGEVLRRTAVLEDEGYVLERKVDRSFFRRGWSNCSVSEEKDGTVVVRVTDMAQCPTSRVVEGAIDWAGITLPIEGGRILVAGPAHKRAETWSTATYFYGPTDLSTAASTVGAKLREQSPRVVGPWTLPDEVRFDVRVRGVDAKVWLKPCSLHKARYLFQRSEDDPKDNEVQGVLVEIVGLETLPES